MRTVRVRGCAAPEQDTADRVTKACRLRGAGVVRDVVAAHIPLHPLAFGRTAKAAPPFPSDPHYDAKVWEMCAGLRGPGQVLFSNVAPLPRP